MSDLSHNQELQRDLLRDSLPDDFESQVFEATLRTAVRRRRIRTTSRAVTGLTALVAAWAALYPFHDTEPKSNLQSAAGPGESPAATKIPHQTIRTMPFKRIIVTQPSSVSKIVSASDSLNIVRSSDYAGFFPSRISDEQLLAFLGGRPAALVRYPAGEAEIILFNEKQEPVNIPENGLEIGNSR